MKLTTELIEAYLDASLAPSQAAKLKLWLAGHPADAAKVRRQEHLRRLLADSAIHPSAAQSRKMWLAIKAEVKSEQRPPVFLDFREPWYAFIFRPWTRVLGAGLATAALLVLAFGWHPGLTATHQAEKETISSNANAPASAVQVLSLAPKAKAINRASVLAEKAAALPIPVAAPAETAKLPAKDIQTNVARAEPSEVERALADSGVDGMIDAYLAAQKQAGSLRGMGQQGRPSFERRSLSSPLAGLSQESVSTDAMVDSGALNQARGSRDNNGFWNWRPAAMAMNNRDWSQVKLELETARAGAAESVERSFAGSALTLLSAPGAPLAGQADVLPSTGELRVLGAGRWQLITGSRMARFSNGVSARLPGFRAEGDSLLLDLTFDRGTFSPGTRFTRVAGDAPAEVLDAYGQAMTADEFSAPAGATYNVSGRQLNLH